MRLLVIILSISVVLVSSFNIAVSMEREKEEIQRTNILNYNSEAIKQAKENNRDVSEYVQGKKPLYIDGIVIVNKDYGLPKNFRSPLEEEALDAFDKMKKDASKEGIVLNIRSGYRSYSTQVSLFNRYAQNDGSEVANTYSAKAGFSEHQTGLALDITNRNTNKAPGDWFDDTPEAKWLYENAYKYGFIIRYPQGKEHVTGYIYESWHYRYVGVEHSENFNMNNLTLEEYVGLYKE